MATAEELRSEIAHLERLFRGITDQRTRDELSKMIEELEDRLRRVGDDDTKETLGSSSIDGGPEPRRD